jgi:hypothetical protein
MPRTHNTYPADFRSEAVKGGNIPSAPHAARRRPGGDLLRWKFPEASGGVAKWKSDDPCLAWLAIPIKGLTDDIASGAPRRSPPNSPPTGATAPGGCRGRGIRPVGAEILPELPEAGRHGCHLGELVRHFLAGGQAALKIRPTDDRDE